MVIDSDRKPVLEKYSFGGIQKEAFEILQRYSENPVKDEYNSTKDEFKKFLKQPLTQLFEILGPTQSKIFGPKIETKKRILSKINKNDYGKGGIYSHYWGAFYPTGEKRTNSSQLFVFVYPDGLNFGFTFGDDSGAYIKSFIRRSENVDFSWTSYFHYLESKGISLTKKYENRNSLYKGEKPNFAKYKEMLLSRESNLSLAAHLNIDEVTKEGETLPELVANVFYALSPIFAIASFDNCEDYINNWHDLSTQDDDLEQLFDEGESLQSVRVSRGKNWEDFLAMMNWKPGMPESESLKRLFTKASEPLDEDNPGFQTILFGPPGTGKSKAAHEFALSVATSEQHIEKVQFHQSYSYEHFIEGIKPVTVDGNLTYDVVPGPFVKFCNSARKRSDDHFVMIIDEINRGNLSKIFGELLYLLEYRNEGLPLMYSNRKFSIPPNISLIGTMNSADRSIALVDFAVRRRFKFIEIAPRIEVLEEYYSVDSSEHKFAVQFFKKLNEMINIPNLLIGHSYFLVKDLQPTGLAKDDVEKIYNESIYPLLQEYFGASQRIEEFPKSFSKMWNLLIKPTLAEEQKSNETMVSDVKSSST